MVKRLLLLSLAFTWAISGASSSVLVGQEEEQKVAKRISSEQLLPSSTAAWFSVPDVKVLKERFGETQFGLMTKDPALAGFIDNVQSQMKDWLNKKNLRLGLKIEDVQAVNSGEICIAGVLPPAEAGEEEGGALGRGSHGLILMVDVSKSEEAARKMLAKVAQDMTDRKAQKVAMPDINGQKVSKWVLPKPKNRVRKNATAFQTIIDGWLIASDNEPAFREIIRRMQNIENIDKMASLANNKAFQKVQERSALPEVDDQFSWYIDPIGYLKLAKAIAEQEQEFRQHESNVAEILGQIGFDAVEGVGGQVAFADGKHEMAHRTFMYAPRDSAVQKQKRFFGLLDFKNRTGKPLTPESWVPNDVSAYFTTTWDMAKALQNLGPIIDLASGGKEGDFDKLLKDLKVRDKIDVKLMAEILNGRVTVVSSAARPINAQSERVMIAFRIKPGAEEEAKKQVIAFGGKGNAIIGNTIAGIPYIEFDSTQEEEDPDDVFGNPLGNFPEEEEEEEEDDFRLFEKKYVAVVGGKAGDKESYLLVTNHKDFLKKVINAKASQLGLDRSEDYAQVNEALGKLVSEEALCVRQFGRVDKALEVNYEMIREGKFRNAQTSLARLFNEMLMKAEDADQIQAPKIDGKKLPKDYEKAVAPYLGPMGWASEAMDDGWRITGVMLKKKQVNEVVQKPTDAGNAAERR